MLSLNLVKAKIGESAYSHIEKEAEKEVALAMQMPLLDEIHRARYYKPRAMLGEFLGELESFEKVGLKISPMDLMTLLFKCKLLPAANSQEEFGQRCGGLFPPLVDPALVVRWSEKGDKVDVLVDKHLTQLEASVRERILVTPVNSFQALSGDSNHQASFEKLFEGLGAPFVCYFEGPHLVEKHKQFEPGRIAYGLDDAKDFFCASSIGFRCVGSRDYCFWYSTTWLRTLLNLLRIGSYIHPGQVDFGLQGVQMSAPTFPVFVGEHAKGFYKWDEDKSQSWAKIPDGCLFLSFGYRGLSKAWFDRRTLPHLGSFLSRHRKILDCLANPWNIRATRDVAPALDILSSATQIPDVGAKILLIYCCLEHLFVPTNTKSDNKKYIIGGLNALAPQLLPWFGQLYDLRCDYAHKGFVLRGDTTMRLIMDSMNNAVTLLGAKLAIP